MSTSEKKQTPRKSSVLGLKRIPENATVLSVAQALSSFSTDVTGISIETSRYGHRNALVTFSGVEACETVKDRETVTVDGQDCELFFANSRGNTPNITASQNKVYVKYPETAEFDEIVKMLGDVSIRRPEGAKNYFFATCKDIDQQCEILKTFDNKKVDGGHLSVKIAIDRNMKRSPRNKVSE